MAHNWGVWESRLHVAGRTITELMPMPASNMHQSSSMYTALALDPYGPCNHLSKALPTHILDRLHCLPASPIAITTDQCVYPDDWAAIYHIIISAHRMARAFINAAWHRKGFPPPPHPPGDPSAPTGQDRDLYVHLPDCAAISNMTPAT
jgi:hypothetical protein